MRVRTAPSPCSRRYLRTALLAAVSYALAGASLAQAGAEAQLLIEADTGKVLHAENAGYPWYPASITKLMTTYVTLRAVKDRRLTLDQSLTVSPVAVAQSPSKMGFKAGTIVTVDNALKMMMVKSANDMSVVLAEGVSGSVEAFADEMNRTARRLGMMQTSYVNPNGLPADGQVSSARDLAILARALIRDFPEHELYWHIPAIRFGKRTIRNYNTLIDRYPGADGMKTGFICASGFNLVATATRNGRQLIAVVLGAPSGQVRAYKAAQLLERGFSGPTLSWLTPALGTIDSLAPIEAAPPNLREDMCGKHRRRPAAEEAEGESDDAVASESSELPAALSLAATRPSNLRAADLIAPVGPPSRVVEVYVGPARRAAGVQVAAAGTGVAKLPPPRPAAGALPGQIAPSGTENRTPVAAGAGIPWSTFSATSLAASPPPDLTIDDAGVDLDADVPLPRPRPHFRVRR